MAQTQVGSGQIGSGQVKRGDLHVTDAADAVVRKIVEGPGIKLTSDGGVAGTGDVTVATKDFAARVRRTTDQLIPNEELTTVSFDSEVFDEGGLWVSGSPTVFTIPSGADGIYSFMHGSAFDNNLGDLLLWQLFKNSSLIAETRTLSQNTSESRTLGTIIKCVATDTLSVKVWCGGLVDRNLRTSLEIWMACARIAPA